MNITHSSMRHNDPENGLCSPQCGDGDGRTADSEAVLLACYELAKGRAASLIADRYSQASETDYVNNSDMFQVVHVTRWQLAACHNILSSLFWLLYLHDGALIASYRSWHFFGLTV
jgi:hypothetical protein